VGPSSGQSTGHSRGNSRQHAPPSTYPSGGACPPSSGRQARGMKALPRRHRCSTLPSFGEPLAVDSSDSSDSSARPPRPMRPEVTPSEAPFAAASRRGRSSEVIRGHQRSSEVIRGHQRSSEAIRGQQRFLLHLRLVKFRLGAHRALRCAPQSLSFGPTFAMSGRHRLFHSSLT
jgi:hypothetical protein